MPETCWRLWSRTVALKSALCAQGADAAPSTSPREDCGVLGISNLLDFNTIGTNDADNTHSHKYKASTSGVPSALAHSGGSLSRQRAQRAQGDSRETSAADYPLGGVRANSASPLLLSQTLIFWRRAIKPIPHPLHSSPCPLALVPERGKEAARSQLFTLSRRACRVFCLEQFLKSPRAKLP
jgi:hypothetical protein